MFVEFVRLFKIFIKLIGIIPSRSTKFQASAKYLNTSNLNLLAPRTERKIKEPPKRKKA